MLFLRQQTIIPSAARWGDALSARLRGECRLFWMRCSRLHLARGPEHSALFCKRRQVFNARPNRSPATISQRNGRNTASRAANKTRSKLPCRASTGVFCHLSGCASTKRTASFSRDKRAGVGAVCVNNHLNNALGATFKPASLLDASQRCLAGPRRQRRRAANRSRNCGANHSKAGVYRRRLFS